jgi:hypothetical protein
MKRIFCIFVVLVGVLSCSGVVRAGEESFSFGPFGRFFLYRGGSPPKGVVLFTGDSGWNKGVADMARNVLVVCFLPSVLLIGWIVFSQTFNSRNRDIRIHRYACLPFSVLEIP